MFADTFPLKVETSDTFPTKLKLATLAKEKLKGKVLFKCIMILVMLVVMIYFVNMSNWTAQRGEE